MTKSNLKNTFEFLLYRIKLKENFLIDSMTNLHNNYFFYKTKKLFIK